MVKHTFHQLLKAFSHDVDIVNVVELVDQIAIVVCALVPLPSCLVGHSIDLCGADIHNAMAIIMTHTYLEYNKYCIIFKYNN